VVLAKGTAANLVPDAFNRMEATCEFVPGAPTAGLALRVNGERLAQLDDPKPPGEDDKDRRLTPSITAYSPGSTLDDQTWFDALFDNYTIWLDDRDTLPPG
jgi:hypothetical protein